MFKKSTKPQAAKSQSPKGFKTVFKHLNKTRLFGIGIFLGASLLPLVALGGNSPYTISYFREIDVNDVQNNTKYSELKTANVSYGKLVRGTNDYNKGNYVLFLGSQRCQHCATFLFNNTEYANGAESGIGWQNGSWGQGIIFADKYFAQFKPKFLMFEDRPPSSLDRTSDTLWTFPWSKFSDSDLSKGHIGGDYVRHDDSAVQFRQIFEFTKALYPNVSGIPTVIAFKNGLPHILGATQSEQKKEGENQETNSETKDRAVTDNFVTFLNRIYRSN